MVILDASVIYKWFVDEEPQKITITARKLRDKFIKGGQSVLAPTILLYELANAFAFKTSLELRYIRKFWAKFTEYNIPVISPNAEFMEKAISFSKKYSVSVYDSSYAVLALENKCDLITADDKFAKQVNLPFVKTLNEFKA